MACKLGPPRRAQHPAMFDLELLLATDTRPIFVIGESLGSGIASYLAATFPEQVAGACIAFSFYNHLDVQATSI